MVQSHQQLQAPPEVEHGATSTGVPASSASLLEALSKSVQQLQTLQAQALQREPESPTAQENVKPGSMTLPDLPWPDGGQSPPHLQDWVEIVGIDMSDLSDRSAEWWRLLHSRVDSAYTIYLDATPIERINVAPVSEDLCSGRWVRVSARACAMLLAVVDSTVRQDRIARRVSQDMTQCVFRLYVLYQAGGSSEKTYVLKQLQHPPSPLTPQEGLTVLREWPRWMQRCKQGGMLLPDTSVLSSSLNRIASSHVSKSPDAAFRTQLLRATLRLDASPTMEGIESYQRHLQAELESIVAAIPPVDKGNKIAVNSLETATGMQPPKTKLELAWETWRL